MAEIDRKKVIKGLEICYYPPSKCENCPYHDLPDGQSCTDKLLRDALTVLKEQEPQKVKLEERKVLVDDSYDEAAYSIDKFFYCPRCNVTLSRTNKNSDIRFCSNCGQAVEWE